MRFEIIEHPADVGFIAYGGTPEELFESAAQAMLTLACDPAGIEERVERRIAASGSGMELLLYGWLAEILAIADAEKLFFCRARVTHLAPERVEGVVYGEPYDKSRHCPGTYLKAVTLHQFRVERTPSGWRAVVYLDV